MNKSNIFPQVTVTCPYCQTTEALGPEEGGQHLFRCRSCSAILKPKSGDCCILCSFGNRDCSSSEQNLAA